MTSIYPSSSTSSANLLRISGMASGIDTDSVVKSMVSKYQTKIDKANQDTQILKWKQDAYRDIIKDVKGLQDYFDPISSKYILSSNSLNTNTASSDETSIISATAGSTAKAGTYNVKVSQLATQAKITGDSKDSLFQVPVEGSEWNNAQLSLDGGAYISLGAITDNNSDGSILDEVATSINNNAGLNAKISATIVNDGKYNHIQLANISGGDITLTAKTSGNSNLISNTTITNANSIDYKEDGSKLWSGTKLAFNFNGTDINPPLTLDTITDTNSNGTTLDEVVSNINKQIASNTTLKGKVSASYVNDGTSSYIKFTKTGTDTIKLTGITSGVNTSLGTTNTSSINSAISSTSNLVSDLGFTSGKDIEFTLANGTTSSNVKLTVSNSSTVQDLIDAVNSATSGTVTMNVDDNTGKISFESKSYGSASSIAISNINADNNIITKLGISTTTGTGTDAIVSIKAPGQSAATTTTQSSNQFTLNGVSYNLVGVNDATNPDSNITVTSNSDTVVTNIKKFIDDYNSIISKINTKLTEKKNSDYAPLTEAQKESMSEDQITAWETKAKVGILRNDDYLSSLLTQLRGAFSSPVYSSYTNSSTNTRISLNFGTYGSGAIGIDTSSSSYTDGGKIYVRDQAKLKSAIENHIEDFKKLFIGESSDTLSTNQSYVGSTKYMKEGIFTRINSILRDYVAAPGVGKDGTYTLSGTMNIFVNKQYDNSISGSSSKNTLPDQVHSKALIISKLKTQMSDAETRYYKKFTALETAMNNLNSQQSQLSSMLGTS